MKLLLFKFIGLIFGLLVYSTVSALSVTTWNLEHLQSNSDYGKWALQCDEDPENRPANMTFCGALDGLTWTKDKRCDFRKGKDLSKHLSDYQDKVSAIRDRLITLNSDVYAFQEINNKEALDELFIGIEGYELFISSSPKSNIHMGYAIKDDLKPNVQQNDDFTIDTCNSPRANELCANHVTRPGLEATLETQWGDVKLLNVHLKSGCQFYAFDDITESGINPHPCEEMDARLDRIITGCATLRDQIPVLEDWVETQTEENSKFIILGDFNRNIRGDLRYEARLDGSDKTSPITSSTKVGSLIKEISDNDPENASIIVGQQVLDTVQVGGYPACWKGIDWIALSESFAEALGWSLENKPKLTGKDFRPYAEDIAIPSDHCPVTLSINPTIDE